MSDSVRVLFLHTGHSDSGTDLVSIAEGPRLVLVISTRSAVTSMTLAFIYSNLFLFKITSQSVTHAVTCIT